MVLSGQEEKFIHEIIKLTESRAMWKFGERI